MPKITYCVLTLNRLEELQKAVRLTAPYVDQTIVLDGCSTDGTGEWLASQECDDLNVDYEFREQHLYQYGNHNPDKRNPYLEMAGSEGWILVMDTDEFLEELALQNLQTIIATAEQEGCDGVSFRPHDIWTTVHGEVIRNTQHHDYWSPMLFKAYPNQRYEGHTHVRMVRPGAKDKWLKTGFYYQHIKNEYRIWRNSTQNYWTTVGLAQNNTEDSTWLEFHEMMKRHGHLDWHEFDKVMKQGKIPNEIKQWFIDHRNATSTEEASWFVLYFILLHPEENSSQLGSETHNLNWNYTLVTK